MIIPAVPATGLERELLAAYTALDEAQQYYTAALARYRAVLDQIQARDREEARR